MAMLSRILPAILLCAATVAGAAELVKNGDFALEAPGNPGVPAEWSLPGDGSWQRIVDADGRAALQFKGVGVNEPARGRCDYLAPKTGYTVEVSYEGDGVLAPVVRMVDPADQTVLGEATGARRVGPQQMGVTFSTLTADVGIQLFADAAHVKGEAGPGGEVRFTRVALALSGTETPEKLPDIGPNLALGRPYQLDPAPSYGLCSDPGDATQLTDGLHTEGHFWTRQSTVGWGGQNVLITIDLGQDQPIRGLSFNTAAGVAQVRWPNRMLVLVSPDGESWYDAGNLLALNARHNNLPEYGQYAVRHIWTDELDTHGRYVALFVEPTFNSYTFVDEIEVFGGPAELLQKPYRGEAFASPKQRMDQSVVADLIRDQFRRALAAARDDMMALPAEQKAQLIAQADGLAGRIEQYQPPAGMTNFRAVLPVDELEADLFRLQAAVWRAQKKPTLRVWGIHRWEMLDSFSEPAEAKPVQPLEVHMMNNEHRGGVVNLTNAGEGDLRVRLRVTGLYGGDNPAYMKAYEVLTVGTRRFVPVTSAMPEARKEGNDYIVTIPSGMTRQVWLSFHPGNLAPKTYSGQVEINPATGNRQTVPLKLVIYPLRFPDETSLHLGGWEYSDGESTYGMTAQNKAAFVEHLQEHYVNTPWAGSSAMFSVAVDGQGNIKEPAETTRFDNWVRLWPKAKMYMVFLNCGNEFGGSKIGDPDFGLKVGNWARFWSDHMRELGLDPSQLGILIYDEPNNKTQYDLITAWARAIEAAAPELVTWEDPQPQDAVDPLEMFASVDVLCPFRSPFLDYPQWYRDLFMNLQQQGKELWFYNAAGPARSFDPYSFYLMQAWHAFAIGAKGSHFWAFGDSGGVSCWNEYPAQGNGPYCPSYLDETSVTTSKYMEAIRESVEDFEYLTMLQQRVAELEQKGVKRPAVAAAKELLADGPARVLVGEQGANYRWDEKKDRTVQDEVRVEVLKALVTLQKM